LAISHTSVILTHTR